jgi:hypothetical protein
MPTEELTRTVALTDRYPEPRVRVVENARSDPVPEELSSRDVYQAPSIRLFVLRES